MPLRVSNPSFARLAAGANSYPVARIWNRRGRPTVDGFLPGSVRQLVTVTLSQPGD